MRDPDLIAADGWDRIDESLRDFRRSRAPFGGLRLVLVGDPLSSVAGFVDRGYWFAEDWNELPLATFSGVDSLSGSRSHFARAMKAIRSGDASRAMERLESRVSGRARTGEVLFAKHLEKLDTEGRRPFVAAVSGNVYEEEFPFPCRLAFAPGDPMLLKCGVSKLAFAEYVDGSDARMSVRLISGKGSSPMEVHRNLYDKIRYRWCKLGALSKERVGEYLQYPAFAGRCATGEMLRGSKVCRLGLDPGLCRSPRELHAALLSAGSLPSLRLARSLREEDLVWPKGLDRFVCG